MWCSPSVVLSCEHNSEQLTLVLLWFQACVDGNAECVFPCPSFMYTDEEIRTQYAAYIASGLLSFPLNVFLLATLVKMGKKGRAKVQSGIKHAAAIGALYAFWDIFLVTALYTDMACGCGPDSNADLEFGTEICQGESIACRFSKVSIFLLMSIFYWITTLMTKVRACVFYPFWFHYGSICPLLFVRFDVCQDGRQIMHCLCLCSAQVFAQIVLGWGAKNLRKLEKTFPLIGFGIPLVMAIIALVRDFRPYEDPNAPNAALAIIRDSFSCKPRLATFAEEMGVITGHFICCGVIIIALIIGIVRQIITVQSKTLVRSDSQGLGKILRTVGDVKNAKVGLLLVMGAWMTCLVAINIAVTATNAPVMEAFKVQADEWRQCKFTVSLMCHGFVNVRGVNCDPLPCRRHEDCGTEGRAYCTEDGVCSERCHECYEKNDGIGGECSSYNCEVSTHMPKMGQCIFRYCAEEVRVCHSESGSNCIEDIVQALTSQGKGPAAAQYPLTDGVACAIRNGCSDHTNAPVGSGTCVEPFSDNPACDCLEAHFQPGSQSKNVFQMEEVGCLMHSLTENGSAWIVDPKAELLLPFSFCYIRDGANCPLTADETTFAGKSAQELDDQDYIMQSK